MLILLLYLFASSLQFNNTFFTILTFFFSLDFNNFVTTVTPVTGLCGGGTADTFTVTSPSGATIPVICGTNTDQHSKLRMQANAANM